MYQDIPEFCHSNQALGEIRGDHPNFCKFWEDHVIFCRNLHRLFCQDHTGNIQRGLDGNLKIALG